jgi:maleate isomerase
MMDLTYFLNEMRATQLGLIVLQADESLERDMWRMLPEGSELLVTRVPSGLEVTTESLSAMENGLSEAASRLPAGAGFSVVGYGCTSGTAQIGAGQIKTLVQDGIKTPEVTEPVSALIAACHALGISKLGVISPYIASVSDKLCDVLEEAKISIVTFASFNEAEESRVVRISEKSIKEPAIAMGQSDCDAVFLSCTNLRTLDVIDPIEAEIGKPVLSSNQVLCWHMMKLAGLEKPAFAPGRLWKV